MCVLVHGGYSEWEQWSACSTTCQDSIRSRSRKCTNPIPQNSGNDCSLIGAHTEVEVCNATVCGPGRVIHENVSFPNILTLV